ncbi:YkvA family protein [Nocardiopsis algeriensis]
MRKENRAAAGAAAWQVIQNTDSRISVWQRLAAVPRMLWSGLRGRYPELGRSKLIGMLLMAAYIVSPIDFVPELFIPLLGLADDVGIAVWLATMALGESERFLEWERRNQAQQAFQQANPDPRAGQPQEGHASGAGGR